MSFQRIQRLIFVMTLILSLLLLVIAILPGDWSPLGSLQAIANGLTRDGSFGGLDLSFYQKFQKIILIAGVVLLAGSGMLTYARRSGRSLFARNLTTAFGIGYLLVLLIVGNLVIGRSNSFMYRQIFGVIPPTHTPIPIVSPTPFPTPIAFGKGRWQIITEDIDSPTAVVDPGDGSGRLFVLEETGTIRVIQGSTLSPEPFLDLKDRVLQRPENFEQGLLGLAFHPNFAENGYFYVFYTDYQENSVLSRFQANDHGQTGDPNSEFRLLGILKPGARHNGGTLVFGPDGYLYASVGDGDLRQKTKGHAQSLDELFGKILRLDVDHGNPYAIPLDNPFVDAYGRDEIYLYGLRNPWKFSFDSVTGDLYLGDVGQNDWEEINFLAAGQPAGLNYGWDVMEGPEDFSGYRGAPVENPVFIAPVYYYHHKPNKCAVTGGVVYHGVAFPDLQGTYLFGDFCAGYVWGLKQSSGGEWEATLLYDTEFQITSFGTDAAGEVYIADMRGKIFKLVP
jgi:glucose/arabinose dehydrogenase